MREDGPVRLRFTGDEVAAAQHVGRARVLLGGIKAQMPALKLQQMHRTFEYSDGVTIRVSSVFGQDTIEIDVPTETVPKTVVAPTSQESTQTVKLSFSVQTTAGGAFGDPIATNWAQRTDIIAGSHISMGITADQQIVALEATDDRNDDLVDTAGRCVKAGLFEFAAKLLNVMSFDAALAADDGFFVELGMFSGLTLVQQDRLSKYAAPYDLPFVHMPHGDELATLLAYDTPAEYMVDYTPYYATPQNAAVYAYDPDRRLLKHSLLLNSLGPFIFSPSPSGTPEPGYDDLPIVAPSTLQMASEKRFSQANLLGAQTGNDFNGIALNSDWIYRSYFYRFEHDYPTLGTTDRSGPVYTAGGAAVVGPTEGSHTMVAYRVRARRNSQGWNISKQTIAPEPRMQFTLHMPAAVNYYPVPFGSTVSAYYSAGPTESAVVIPCVHENEDGSQVTFQTATITQSDVDPNGWIPPGPADTSATPHDGPYPRPVYAYYPSVLPGHPSCFYPNQPTPVRTSARCRLHMFLNPKGGFVTLYSDGVIEGKDVDTVVGGTHTAGPAITPIPPVNPATWAAPSSSLVPMITNEQAWQIPYAATDVAALAAGTLDVALRYFNPVRTTDYLLVPPVTGFISVIYEPSSGHFLYVALKTATGGGASAFNAAALKYFQKIADPALFPFEKLATIEAALLALVNIPVNTGLPAKYAAFAFFQSSFFGVATVAVALL